LLPVLGHARDARFVEQVAAVGQAAAQAAVEVGDLQVQVELGGTGIVGQVLDLHAGQHGFAGRPSAARCTSPGTAGCRRSARRLQRFDQLLERQVLVRLAVDGGVAHLLEQRWRSSARPARSAAPGC
jgi:hypothetical protein